MLEEKIDFEKRETIKNNLFKAGLVGAGIIGLSSITSATSIFWRDETGVLTDITKDDLSGVSGVVEHGATAGTTRPSGYKIIIWIGSVSPTNAVNTDIWIDTS